MLQRVLMYNEPCSGRLVTLGEQRKVRSMLSGILENGSPKSSAVVVPNGATVDYSQLIEEVERVAGLLSAAGAKPGTPASIVLGNTLEYLVTFLAVTRMGGIAAPLNPAYTAKEFRFYMEDCGSRLAVLSPDASAARKAAGDLGITVLEATSADRGTIIIKQNETDLTKSRDTTSPTSSDVALFLHTSGTTSRPKGVPLTHDNLLASLTNIRDTYQLTPDDVSMIVMPLFHVHGLLGAALATLSSGGTVVIPPRFTASGFWPVQRATRATWYSAVPTIHKILLDRADDDDAPSKSFRFIRSCSSPLSTAIFTNLEERFNAPVLEAYGMTEASHQMSSNPLPPSKRVPGTVGPGTGVQIAIMDEGGILVNEGVKAEVVIQGPNVMHCYNNNPTANAEAFTKGWFRTGDQGVLDKNGYLTLTGRLKELVNRGGEKISPIEVEDAIMLHPAVSEVVCFAMPDTKYGEVVHAAVVLNDKCDEHTIRVFCGERLAEFKVPDRVHLTDNLPRTATGKVQRRHVAAKFSAVG